MICVKTIHKFGPSLHLRFVVRNAKKTKKKLAAFPPISMPKSSYALSKSSYALLIFHSLVFHPASRIDGFYLPPVSTHTLHQWPTAPLWRRATKCLCLFTRLSPYNNYTSISNTRIWNGYVMRSANFSTEYS